MARIPSGFLRRAATVAALAVVLGSAGAAAAVYERPDLAAVVSGKAPPGAGPPGTSVPGVGGSIGPGTVTETAGAGICTAGFVFTGGGRVLLGQAAHCAGTGPETETDGCTSATLRPGVPVVVRGADGPLTGTLRYSSWVAMQDGGERDPDVCAGNDFALVELPRAAVVRTGASLPVIGGPVGLRDTPPEPGSSVYGLAGGRTVTSRSGNLGPDRNGGWLHIVRTPVPGRPGESGGPLVDDRGAALGVLSGAEVGGAARLEYTDLARALAYARTHGAAPDLVLTPGTAPFSVPPG